jgi:hypothetical protein
MKADVNAMCFSAPDPSQARDVGDRSPEWAWDVSKADPSLHDPEEQEGKDDADGQENGRARVTPAECLRYQGNCGRIQAQCLGREAKLFEDAHC